MTYFNTNAETGPELAASRRMVRGQEADILALFRRHPDRGRTSRELQAVFGIERTSVTRALRGLTDRGHLEKSEKPTTRCGWTGKQVHTWRLPKREPMRQGELF